MHLHLHPASSSSTGHVYTSVRPLLPHTPSTTSPHGSRPTKLHRATCYRHHLEPTIFFFSSFFFLLFSAIVFFFFFFSQPPSHATTIASRSSSEAQALQSCRCRRRMTRCKGGKSPLKGFTAGRYRTGAAARYKVLWPGQLVFYSFSSSSAGLLVPLFSFLHLSCFSLLKLLFLHLPPFFFLLYLV